MTTMIDERTQMLTTPDREKKHIGYKFNCNNIVGDHDVGDFFPVRTWNEENYGIAKIVKRVGKTYYLEIVMVW